MNDNEAFLKEKARLYLDAEAITLFGSSVFLFGKTYNLLYEIDLYSNNIKLWGGVPDKTIREDRLIGKIIVNNYKIYLLPLREKRMWIVNRENGAWSSYILENANKSEHMFFQGFLYNDIIHMIGCEYPYIIKFNCKNDSILYDNKIYNEIDNDSDSHGDIYFRSDFMRDNNIITIGCCKTNKFLVYNLEKQETSLIEYKGLSDYESVIKIYDDIYCLSRTKKEFMIVNKNGEKRIFQIPDYINLHCIGMKRIHEDILLASNEYGQSCVLKNNGQFELFDEKYTTFRRDETTCYSLTVNGDLKIETMEKEYVLKTCIDINQLINLWKEKWRQGELIQEKTLGINGFIELVSVI